MPDGFNIGKFPESPWFWVLVAIAAFLILLATGHPSTAVVLLFLGIGVICLIANLFSSNPSAAIWWTCGICFVIALILGLSLVPIEWSQSAIPPIPTL